MKRFRKTGCHRRLVSHHISLTTSQRSMASHHRTPTTRQKQFSSTFVTGVKVPLRRNWQRSSPAVKLLLLIPALNEERHIRSIVEGARRYIPEALVLVIDDGSKDDTASAAALGGAVVQSLRSNMGKGEALKVGFRYALDHG